MLVSSQTRPTNEAGTEAPSASSNVRLAARRGTLTGTTAGLAPGYVQGNLVVLPASMASDFLRFAQRNPKPCPLIGVSEPGSRALPELGWISTSPPTFRNTASGGMAN